MDQQHEIPHRFIDTSTLSGPVLQQIIRDAERHIEEVRRRIALGAGYSAGDFILSSFAKELEAHAITAVRARTALDRRTLNRSLIIFKHGT